MFFLYIYKFSVVICVLQFDVFDMLNCTIDTNVLNILDNNDNTTWFRSPDQQNVTVLMMFDRHFNVSHHYINIHP